MKVGIDITVIGKIDGNEDTYKKTELVKVHNLSEDTTLGELEIQSNLLIK